MIGKNREALRIKELCRSLAERGGPAYWRGLQELAETDEFRAYVADEFPHLREGSDNPINRRQFMTVLAASLAIAGLEGCTRQPPEEIVPRVRQPEYAVPGRALYYATAMNYRGIAQPVLVTSHEGRPTKIEGNPEHPASKGATSAITQAMLWGLYDPNRSKVVTRRTNIATWEAFRGELRDALEQQRLKDGGGLRILCEPTSSPTLIRQKEWLLKRFPEAHWHVYEPFGRDSVYAGADLAFGRTLCPRHHFNLARVILSFDADFLLDSPSAVADAHDFIEERRVRAGRTEMNRLYVVETTPSITGASADHRIAARPDDILLLAGELARGLRINGIEAPDSLPDEKRKWIRLVTEDLNRHRGESLVIAGDSQPPAVHALVHAINDALGNLGRAVTFTRPVIDGPYDTIASLGALADALHGEHVDLLLVLGGNPAFTAPAEFDFAHAMRQARMSVRFGLYEDETTAACTWHIPASHELETWSDLRSADGTATIIQPLIDPLYNNKSVHELLEAMISTEALPPQREFVRDTWRVCWPAGEFEARWEKSVHDGLVAEPRPAEEKVALWRDAVASSFSKNLRSVGARSSSAGQLDVVLAPDPTLCDGRYANNPWLQELPKPITKLTWDGAALISPLTAEAIGIADEQFLEVRDGMRSLRIPVWRVPGHADDCLTIYAGQGRERGGSVANGVGVNAYRIWSAESRRLIRGATVHATSDKSALACTQLHHAMEGRDLIRSGPITDFGSKRESKRNGDLHLSLYPEHPRKDNAWGMVIDLTACIGCNACAAACQVENNIPVVGREEVRRGREMNWIRIDRYFAGSPRAPAIEFQPVPCMHCEDAPCEVVCPVGATVHSNDGLNEMIYNRCVGTRYCSNNCPYKVRRFNFFPYADDTTPEYKLMRNPDVSVRSYGVMEKCTYCVQRISAARIAAKKEDRSIRDGDVVTACQAACPTRAIVFGDLNDPASQIAKLQAEPHRYALLEELNTRPHTTYLARMRNPNPEMEGLSG
jgi:MoCo/4Fe-4S cofactor protein with predicted Tat translocation signal